MVRKRCIGQHKGHHDRGRQRHFGGRRIQKSTFGGPHESSWAQRRVWRSDKVPVKRKQKTYNDTTQYMPHKFDKSRFTPWLQTLFCCLCSKLETIGTVGILRFYTVFAELPCNWVIIYNKCTKGCTCAVCTWDLHNQGNKRCGLFL